MSKGKDNLSKNISIPFEAGSHSFFIDKLYYFKK